MGATTAFLDEPGPPKGFSTIHQHLRATWLERQQTLVRPYSGEGEGRSIALTGAAPP